MQTFLPYQGFAASAITLDFRRLGKQRVEVKQILNALRNGGGWARHPAVLMWAGFEELLSHYGNIIIQTWIDRGYTNNMPFFEVAGPVEEAPMPWWLGLPEFHDAHKGMLYKKDPEHYASFCVYSHIEDYWWPTRNLWRQHELADLT